MHWFIVVLCVAAIDEILFTILAGVLSSQGLSLIIWIVVSTAAMILFVIPFYCILFLATKKNIIFGVICIAFAVSFEWLKTRNSSVTWSSKDAWYTVFIVVCSIMTIMATAITCKERASKDRETGDEDCQI